MSCPYRWDTERPDPLIQRADDEELLRLLRAGERAMVHAGHGMGKSVLLRWLESSLQNDGLQVIRLPAPEGVGLSEALRQALDAAAGLGGAPDLRAAVTAACERSRTVILIDEVDAWVDGDRAQATCEALGVLGKLSQDVLYGRLGVLVAGGLRQLLLTRSPWGSVFASRVARTVFLKPLGGAEIEALAAPLREKRGSVDPRWLAELALASGGIPALVTRGLELAWAAGDDPLPLPNEALHGWVRTQRAFATSVRASITLEGREHATRLLDRIRAAPDGEVPSAELRALCPPESTYQELVDLLVAAGLVHPDHDLHSEPALVRANPSVLHEAQPSGGAARSPLERLWADLRAAAGELSLHRADLRIGAKEKRHLVPEALFSAMLSMALRARGWDVLREAQQGEGRTDLRVTGNRLDGHVIVEVKRWGNADLPKIGGQLLGYVSAEPGFVPGGHSSALAAVIVAGPRLSADELRARLPRLAGGAAEETGAVYTWRGREAVSTDKQLPTLTVAVVGLFHDVWEQSA
ncbi:MAG: ATP-binding protein [Deltaproteobacteria bacterium]|nr:ATP-binding protein [Deltaproteobacteria bacterium]